MRLLADKQWADLESRGVLRIGIDPGWQPFSFYDDQGWDGIDAEVAKEIAKRLHMRIETIPVGYDSLYDALHLWQVDIVLSAVVADPARTIDFAYTSPYFEGGQRVVSLRSKPISAASGLTGLRVASVLGTDGDWELRYWERRLPGVKRVETSDLQIAIELLHQETVDAIVTDALDATRIVSQEQDTVSATLTRQSYVIAVRRDNPRLLAQLDQIIFELQSDGTLAKIMTRWASH